MQTYAFTLNQSNFNDQVLSNGRPWLVEFYSPTCMHCQELAPIIQQVASNFGNVLSVG